MIRRVPPRWILERSRLRIEHRDAIYPHGFRACRCGAGEGESCLSLGRSGKRFADPRRDALRHAHQWRGIAPGYGIENWLKSREEQP